MDKGPFIATEEGVFLPADEPDSIAGRMSAHELSIRHAVDEWLIIEGTSVSAIILKTCEPVRPTTGLWRP